MRYIYIRGIRPAVSNVFKYPNYVNQLCFFAKCSKFSSCECYSHIGYSVTPELFCSSEMTGQGKVKSPIYLYATQMDIVMRLSNSQDTNKVNRITI